MNDKINPTHLERAAYVYVRQSTAAQVQHNRESTDRQYKLAQRALRLGWSEPQIKVVDEDLARSGSGTADRHGFALMTAEVGLGHVGLILSIEVSRVARNNADWYRLLDLCGVTDTLIGDEDGLYHPGLFNDRLLLGLKGTMAEAELHVIRARLEGGIRNKAARGELRRGLPVGFVWGDHDGEVLFHPDEAVTHAVRCVFEKFTEVGSARQVWLWFRAEGLAFPSPSHASSEIQWVTPTYTGIHQILTNPVYAGAYTYGKTHYERYVDQAGQLKKRVRHVPQSKWAVLIRDHHKGFVDWETYEMNQSRIARNTHPTPHKSGAVREGSALLQGLATCGVCGRHLRVYYQGRHATPGYYCAASAVVNGRGQYCMRVSGVRINEAVAQAFLDAITPAGIKASLLAEQNLEADHEAACAQWRLQAEKARYESERAERRYRSVEPENRLVARTLEAAWEKQLGELASAEAELARRLVSRPGPLSDGERMKIRALGADLRKVWEASTTTDRDRKELLHALLDEVNISVAGSTAHITIRWKGGTVSEFDVDLKSRFIPPVRTDEETIDLVRRLAVHYPDAVIAGILNRQGRRTALGDRFTQGKVGNLRRYWKVPRFERGAHPEDGELVTIAHAAKILDMAPSTLHRWLADGFIAGEQITPGSPWRIRLSDEIRARFVEAVPQGHVPMVDAMRLLGVSRQTVLHRVKRGELAAVHVRCGRRKGLYIKVLGAQHHLFDNRS
jgi:DNA invertase Pin-like site-specific DNA recombinase